MDRSVESSCEDGGGPGPGGKRSASTTRRVAVVLFVGAVLAAPVIAVGLGTAGPASTSGTVRPPRTTTTLPAAEAGGSTGISHPPTVPTSGTATSQPPATVTTSHGTATSQRPATVPVTVTVKTTVPPPSGQGTTTGTVTGPDGQPLAGAYVIGLDNLAVTTTGSDGSYSMPCTSQPLVAASWLLPVYSPKPGPSGGWLFGVDTTKYGMPPTSPAPGYQFSGGAEDLAHATTVSCDGQPVDFQLPQGGSVVISWKTPTGASPASASDPLDNLYVPGLGSQSALEGATLTPDNQQVVDGLAGGMLRIDEVNATFSCAGAGVDAANEVTVTPGQATDVTCTITGP